VDAGIGCWKIKYQYNQERPITYIRGVLGYSTWNSLFPAPNFPDFTSAHSAIAGVFSAILTDLFGNNYHFTDHSYDYLGMAPRPYDSFDALAQEIGAARLYAGIHYRISCERGVKVGGIIGQNINNKLKFKK
jgi:membrane-associated phospholipid phosphatase